MYTGDPRSSPNFCTPCHRDSKAAEILPLSGKSFVEGCKVSSFRASGGQPSSQPGPPKVGKTLAQNLYNQPERPLFYILFEVSGKPLSGFNP